MKTVSTIPEERLAEHVSFLRREAGRLRAGLDGSDLAQEAWVAALEAARRGNGPRPEAGAAWLRKILRNKAAEIGRRVRAFRRGGVAAHVPLENDVVGPATSPSRKVRRGDQEDRLARALNSLSPQDRRVIHLTLVEDCRSAEVAAVLGVSDGYARRLRRQALERLRAAYVALGGRPDFS